MKLRHEGEAALTESFDPNLQSRTTYTTSDLSITFYLFFLAGIKAAFT